LNHKLANHYGTLKNLKSLTFGHPLKTDPFKLLIEENFTGTASAVAIKKKVCDEVGAFNVRYKIAEDYDYFLRCAALTDFVLNPSVLLYKRDHDINLTNDIVQTYRYHKKVLVNTMADQSLYIAERKYEKTCSQSLAHINYELGSLYYERGNLKKCFKLYREGLRCAATWKNAALFLRAALKKLIRTATFNTLNRKKISLLFRRRAHKASLENRFIFPPEPSGPSNETG
jgi:hypothetical protein